MRRLVMAVVVTDRRRGVRGLGSRRACGLHTAA